MIPKFYQCIHPVLKLLSKENHSRKSAVAKLISSFNMSDEEKNQKLASGGIIFENRIGWTFTYLTKAEYIELTEQKAVYRITNLGKDALSKAKDITIDVEYLQKNSPNYSKNWQVIRNNKNSKDSNESNSDFDLEAELDRVEKDFDSDLLRRIKCLSWQDFEDLCASLLEKMGYGVASTREIRSSDGGIDRELFEDELGLKGKIYIQAKKRDNNNIQPKDVKEFLYNVGGNKGVFITTSDFSQKAKDEVINYKEGKVALINYGELIRLCKKYQVFCKNKPFIFIK